MSSMKIKVILENDIRLWRYSTTDCTLSSLKEFVSSPSSFGLAAFWLQWEDDEGDRITLQEEDDFNGALCCAQEEDRKSLKIYVVRGSNKSVHSPRTAPRNDPNPASSPKSTSSVPMDSEFDRCSEMRVIAMDFLQNPEIIKLLPDLHRRLFEEIRKCKDIADRNATSNDVAMSSEMQWDSASNIERLLCNLLESDNTFSAITNHPLYRKKLKGMIPVLCRKMSAHLPILMQFSSEAIAAWIPHLASVLGHGFNTFDSFGSSSMSSFFPIMCSFMTRHGDFDVDGNVLHHGVQCDNCGCTPIKGARFKCAVCSDFDLCAQCESLREHDPNHPMIKFMSSAGNAVPPFLGLHEMVRGHGAGPQKWFGPQWRSRNQGHGQQHQQRQHGGRGVDGGDRNRNGNERNQGANGFSGIPPQGPPPPGFQPQGMASMWNQGGHHWGQRGHRGWRRWNRWQSHHQPNGPWAGPHGQHIPRNNPWPGMHGHSQHDQAAQHHASQWMDHRRDPREMNPNGGGSSMSAAPKERERKYKVVAEFVTDVNLPDRTYYPTDTVLTKTWRMRNSGDHPWGSNVELVFFKGNESLTLEQRYPVNNAQPGEEVEVSAVIKTPTKPGRYCSYYRLQRNREFFGPRVWVDIFAVDEVNEDQKGDQQNVGKNGRKYQRKEAKLNGKQKRIESKMEKLQRKQARIQQKVDRLKGKNGNIGADAAGGVGQGQNEQVQDQQDDPPPSDPMESRALNEENANGKKMVDEQQLLDDIANAAVQDLAPEEPSAFSCVCGSTLHKTSPMEAYQSANSRVDCDLCGKFCPSSSAIYHCPEQKNLTHPKGYDVCASCLELQMQGFVGLRSEPPPRQRQQHQQQPQQPVDPPHFEPAPPVLVPPLFGQEPVQNPVVLPIAVNGGQEVEPQVFEYQAQLEQLKAMGFAEDDAIKAALVEQQGNVQRVANRLLQQQ